MGNFCPSCSSQLNTNANFCPKCGTRIEKKTSMANQKPVINAQIGESNQQQQEPVTTQVHPSGGDLSGKQCTDIFVDGTIHIVKQGTQDVFQRNGFKVEWYSQHSGRAKKGNVGMTIAFGSITQAYTIDFQIFNMPDGRSGVRLFKTSSGWSGGAWGSVKTKRKYYEIVEMLSNDFYARGMYKGRYPE